MNRVIRTCFGNYQQRLPSVVEIRNCKIIREIKIRSCHFSPRQIFAQQIYVAKHGLSTKISTKILKMSGQIKLEIHGRWKNEETHPGR